MSTPTEIEISVLRGITNLRTKTARVNGETVVNGYSSSAGSSLRAHAYVGAYTGETRYVNRIPS